MKDGFITDTGEFGQVIAMEKLHELGYQCTKIANPPFQLEARLNGKVFLVAVRTRKHTTDKGTIKKDGYNLFEKWKNDSAEADILLEKFKAEALWVAVTVNVGNKTYSAYFGRIDELAKNSQIPMSPKHISGYVNLAINQYDGRMKIKSNVKVGYDGDAQNNEIDEVHATINASLNTSESHESSGNNNDADKIIDDDVDDSYFSRLSYKEIVEKYEDSRKLFSGNPKFTEIITKTFKRDKLLVFLAKMRANYRCEVPNCHHPVFIANSGKPYCEVHHIIPLESGGEDDRNNVICLCPAHHREAHHGKFTDELKAAFFLVRKKSH
jgi:hypothetical protein